MTIIVIRDDDEEDDDYNDRDHSDDVQPICDAPQCDWVYIVITTAE